jgi:hypothetical protein
VAGGECRVFEAPPYAVLGRDQYDQRWIDANVEAGVGGCGWQRPKPRPEILAKAPVRASGVSKKRPTLHQRVKARVRKILHRPEPPPVTLLAPAPPPAAKEWQDLTSSIAPVAPGLVKPPPPVPRSDLDELLDPRAPSAETLGLRGSTTK